MLLRVQCAASPREGRAKHLAKTHGYAVIRTSRYYWDATPTAMCCHSARRAKQRRAVHGPSVVCRCEVTPGRSRTQPCRGRAITVEDFHTKTGALFWSASPWRPGASSAGKYLPRSASVGSALPRGASVAAGPFSVPRLHRQRRRTRYLPQCSGAGAPRPRGASVTAWPVSISVAPGCIVSGQVPAAQCFRWFRPAPASGCVRPRGASAAAGPFSVLRLHRQRSGSGYLPMCSGAGAPRPRGASVPASVTASPPVAVPMQEGAGPVAPASRSSRARRTVGAGGFARGRARARAARLSRPVPRRRSPPDARAGALTPAAPPFQRRLTKRCLRSVSFVALLVPVRPLSRQSLSSGMAGLKLASRHANLCIPCFKLPLRSRRDAR